MTTTKTPLFFSDEILGTPIRSAQDREFRRRSLAAAIASLSNILAGFDACDDSGAVPPDPESALPIVGANVWVDVSAAINDLKEAKRGLADDDNIGI
jgi:hypothetical protein